MLQPLSFTQFGALNEAANDSFDQIIKSKNNIDIVISAQYYANIGNPHF